MLCAGGAQRRHHAGLWRLSWGAGRLPFRVSAPPGSCCREESTAADRRSLPPQPALFKALNDALSVVGVRVTTSDGDVWSVSEGRSLMRFSDGMVRARWHGFVFR